MYENGEQYTANAVLVLHVLKCVGEPITDFYLTDLMMGPGLVNYFTMEQCLDQLTEGGFVTRRLDSMGIALYSITEKGEEMLSSMKYMLSGGLGARYEAYVRKQKAEISGKMHIDATCFEDSNGNLYVRCFVRDGLMGVVDVTLPVGNKEDGEQICTAWRNDSSSMYIQLMKALYDGAKINLEG
ncbi:MAG: DUF4364 family protein [Clostridia bacterium]|nr:DUF4364 family protein [Clostridia bacterium]